MPTKCNAPNVSVTGGVPTRCNAPNVCVTGGRAPTRLHYFCYRGRVHHTPVVSNTSCEKPAAHQSPAPNAKSATPPVAVFLLVFSWQSQRRGPAAATSAPPPAPVEEDRHGDAAPAGTAARMTGEQSSYCAACGINRV